MLRTPLNFQCFAKPPGLQALDNALHQHLGRRGTGGNADTLQAGKPLLAQVIGAVDQISRSIQALCQLAQAIGVGAIRLPTTSTTSHSAASCFTASWRFCVA